MLNKTDFTFPCICSGPGDCEKTPGGMSGGVSVCVRAVCKLTMQTIWNEVMHSVSPLLLAKRDRHAYFSPLKSKTVLGQLKCFYVLPCSTRPYDWAIIKIR